jgi:hypothetical protein
MRRYASGRWTIQAYASAAMTAKRTIGGKRRGSRRRAGHRQHERRYAQGGEEPGELGRSERRVHLGGQVGAVRKSAPKAPPAGYEVVDHGRGDQRHEHVHLQGIPRNPAPPLGRYFVRLHGDRRCRRRNVRRGGCLCRRSNMVTTSGPPDRLDQASVRIKLVCERRRNARPGRGHEVGVERGLLGETVGAVANRRCTFAIPCARGWPPASRPGRAAARCIPFTGRRRSTVTGPVS